MTRWIAKIQWLRWARQIALALGVGVAFIIIIFQLAVICWPYPPGIDHLPPAATFISDRHGEPLAALVNPQQQWFIPIKGDQINPHLRDAIVAVEDGRFYEHHGVDWRCAASAAWQDLTHLSFKRGASTLTMQVQRLRDPAPRSLANKFAQAVRACQLEKQLNKQQILDEYLNRAPFGGNLIGAEAASWRYFARPCASLSLGQCALLAGVPQNPNHFRPDRYPQLALQRRKHVLDRMLTRGMITQIQRDQADVEPIDACWRALPQVCTAAPRPEQFETPQLNACLPALLGLARHHPGRRTTTTLDAATDRQAAAATMEHLRSLRAAGVRCVCVVVLDTPTSQVLASVSVDLSAKRPGMDLAAQPRSSGSTLKPFIYAAAFDAGICQPKSILLDAPSAWPGYAPHNFDHDFRGPLPAADALAQSRNIPAMVLLAKVGVEHSVGLMGVMGLHTLANLPRAYGLPLAIGGAEVTPLELAGAYATLARGGMSRNVTYVLPAGSQDQPAWPTEPIIGSRACWDALIALSSPARTRHLCPEAAELGIAWKTGTSSGRRDAWCAAVSSRRTVVVWLGNPSGQGADCLVGIDAAAPLALRLLASLDPLPTVWPADTTPAAVEPGQLVPRPGPTLTLVCPGANEQFIYDPDLPPDKQRISFRTAGVEGENLWWFIDGSEAGHGPCEQPFWWSPTPGQHHLRVFDALGHARAVSFSVR